jgi:phage shock protein PspC (stress-responsive transcriptional regulator)
MSLRSSLFRKKWEKLQVGVLAGIAITWTVFLAEVVLLKNDPRILRHINLVIPLCAGACTALVLWLLLVVFVRNKEKAKP